MSRFYNHQCNFKVFIKQEHTHTDFFKVWLITNPDINNPYLWVIESYLIFFSSFCVSIYFVSFLFLQEAQIVYVI